MKPIKEKDKTFTSGRCAALVAQWLERSSRDLNLCTGVGSNLVFGALFSHSFL